MYFTVFLSSEGEGCPGGGDSEHLTEFSALHCPLETPAGVGGMSSWPRSVFAAGRWEILFLWGRGEWETTPTFSGNLFKSLFPLKLGVWLSLPGSCKLSGRSHVGVSSPAAVCRLCGCFLAVALAQEEQEIFTLLNSEISMLQ